MTMVDLGQDGCTIIPSEVFSHIHGIGLNPSRDKLSNTLGKNKQVGPEVDAPISPCSEVKRFKNS